MRQRHARHRRTDQALRPPVDLPADRWGLLDRILWQQGPLLVIDKPSGLAVHGGPATPESLEDYLPLFGRHPARPAIAVHRIDRDTSGCLMLAQTPGAAKAMMQAFAGRRVEKTYLARVQGSPPASSGLIDAPLAKRSRADTGWWMRVARDGQAAQTRYKLLETRDGSSLLALTPLTGRTHQLRVHCAHLGCPILGDAVYGDAASAARLMLHAQRLCFEVEPGQPVVVEAPAPEAFG